ncbi:hypothetical protein J2W14_003305 [Pseudarthrobacter oxydans]|nr:hypothetical protein [Pseudarthrobacter oxydans]
MRQLKRPPLELRVSPSELKTDEGEWRGWSSGATATLEFKEAFLEWAVQNQAGRCAYCTLPVGTVAHRRTPSIDHFAPKSRKLAKDGSSLGYPRWTFEPLNLVVACFSCNSSMKDVFNPVLQPARDSYTACRFSVVHPYLDTVSQHIIGGYHAKGMKPAPIIGITDEGRRTIEHFELANAGLFQTWFADYRNERRTAILNRLPIRLRELYLRISKEVTPS